MYLLGWTKYNVSKYFEISHEIWNKVSPSQEVKNKCRPVKMYQIGKIFFFLISLQLSSLNPGLCGYFKMIICNLKGRTARKAYFVHNLLFLFQFGPSPTKMDQTMLIYSCGTANASWFLEYGSTTFFLICLVIMNSYPRSEDL